jgi:hypothetical protein
MKVMKLKRGKILSEQKEKEEEFNNVKTLNEEYLKTIWKVLFDIPYPTKKRIMVYVLTTRDFVLVKLICGASKECVGFMKENADEYAIVLPEGYNDMSLYHELVHVFEYESLRYYANADYVKRRDVNG